MILANQNLIFLFYRTVNLQTRKQRTHRRGWRQRIQEYPCFIVTRKYFWYQLADIYLCIYFQGNRIRTLELCWKIQGTNHNYYHVLVPFLYQSDQLGVPFTPLDQRSKDEGHFVDLVQTSSYFVLRSAKEMQKMQAILERYSWFVDDEIGSHINNKIFIEKFTVLWK